ncbi:MAG: HAMP domain-containing histidine kinase, partial [Anaerolineae bacterium]|nr:HAMP domain-containing histidine kinase [Anaerolineae bacterium]
AAFLGDVHVQVLDSVGQVIADSDESGEENKLVLVMPGSLREMLEMRGMSMRGPSIIEIDPEAYDLPGGFVQTIPPGTSFTVIRRDTSLWGARLSFAEVTAGESGTSSATKVQTSRVPRSDTTVTVPIGEAEDPIGYVELSGPPALNTTLLDQLRQALLVAGAGAVVVAGLFGMWSSQRMAAPIKSLAETAAQMGAGDLSVRADVTRRRRYGREIGELAMQFNQMADSLQASFDELAAERDALRRFIADASHELRTPITALKNFNTLLLDGAADDPATREEFLTESQAQIERLAWITGHLLDLSRRDAGLVPLALGEHDLRDIARSAVAPFHPRAQAQDINLIVDLPEDPVALRCDHAQLEIALTNLLDNALKFTPAGGTVNVAVNRDATHAAVVVADTGVGIDPEDLPHVCERFYQGRHPGTAQQGVGLGLAIVKSIIEAHDGTIAIDSTPGTGTRVTVELPIRS